MKRKSPSIPLWSCPIWTKANSGIFLEAMNDTQNAPSLSQAQQLKKMAQQGEFSYEKAFDVMGQEKKSEKDTVTIKNDILRKYFPRSYTPRQMEEKIIQLLDAWQKKQQRRNER